MRGVGVAGRVTLGTHTSSGAEQGITSGGPPLEGTGTGDEEQGMRNRGQREQEQDQDLFLFIFLSQAQTSQAVTLTGTGERIKERRGEAKRLAGKPGNREERGRSSEKERYRISSSREREETKSEK